MDFFRQVVCNRRGPHNQGCLFRHDEIEGKGKVVDTQAVASRISPSRWRCSPPRLKGASPSRMGSSRGATWRRRRRCTRRRARRSSRPRRRPGSASRRIRRRARRPFWPPPPPPQVPLQWRRRQRRWRRRGREHGASATVRVRPAGAAAEAPPPPGWKSPAPDGRTYYYHGPTKKTSRAGCCRDGRPASSLRRRRRRRAFGGGRYERQRRRRRRSCGIRDDRAAAARVEGGQGGRWEGLLLRAWREDAMDAADGAGGRWLSAAAAGEAQGGGRPSDLQPPPPPAPIRMASPRTSRCRPSTRTPRGRRASVKRESGRVSETHTHTLHVVALRETAAVLACKKITQKTLLGVFGTETFWGFLLQRHVLVHHHCMSLHLRGTTTFESLTPCRHRCNITGSLPRRCSNSERDTFSLTISTPCRKCGAGTLESGTRIASDVFIPACCVPPPQGS